MCVCVCVDPSLQTTLNKVVMRIVYRAQRENTFAAIFRLLQVRLMLPSSRCVVLLHSIRVTDCVCVCVSRAQRCSQSAPASSPVDGVSTPYMQADNSLPPPVERYLVSSLVKLTKYEESPQQRQGAPKVDAPFGAVNCAIILQELHNLFDCLPLKRDPKVRVQEQSSPHADFVFIVGVWPPPAGTRRQAACGCKDGASGHDPRKVHLPPVRHGGPAVQLRCEAVLPHVPGALQP